MFERLCSVMSGFTEIPVPEMRPDSSIMDDLCMNSIDIMEAVITAEEEFGVEIPDRVVYSFVTLKDIADYLEKNA